MQHRVENEKMQSSCPRDLQKGSTQIKKTQKKRAMEKIRGKKQLKGTKPFRSVYTEWTE